LPFLRENLVRFDREMKANNFTQKQTAAELGVSRSLYNAILSGKNPSPSIDFIDKLTAYANRGLPYQKWKFYENPNGLPSTSMLAIAEKLLERIATHQKVLAEPRMVQTKQVLIEEITHTLKSFAARIERITSGQFPANEREIAVEESATQLGRFIIRLVASVPEPLENWKDALQNVELNQLAQDWITVSASLKEAGLGAGKSADPAPE